MGVGRKEWPPSAGEAHAEEIRGWGLGVGRHRVL